MKFKWIVKTSLALVLLLLPISTTWAQKPKAPPALVQVGSYGPAELNADVLSYQAALNANDFDRASLIRNRIVFNMLSGVDYNYANWKADLFSGNAKKNTIFDIGESALVAAIGLTNVVSTKNAFTAVLQLARGTRASYNKNYFNSQSLAAVISAMDAARLTQRTRIENGLTLAVQEYPLEQGLADAMQYFNEGSIASGLQHLGEQAGASLQAARVEAAEARTVRARALPEPTPKKKQ